MKLREILIPILSGAACLAAGWYLGGSNKSEAAVATVGNSGGGRATSSPAAPSLPGPEDSPQALQGSEPAPDAAAVLTMPTREQAAASMQAHAVLDAAISRRAWTDADAEAFTGYFNELTPEERIATLEKFTMAINQQLMKPDTDRMPF